MTTVATDGRTMAGDGRRCIGDDLSTDASRKLFALPDGSVLGVAGNTSACMLILDWVREGGNREELPKIPDLEDFEALALRLYPTGRLTYASAPLLVELEVDAPFAIGSGSHYARGAMAAGASPAEAVAIAARFDIGTGGDIATMTPGEPA